jgi:PIN domain nuclease of toxin-antitoxin system
VTGYLLDTNIALLGLTAPERISPGDAPRSRNRAGLSWRDLLLEVLLKSIKGKLDVGDPRAWWPEALEGLAATPLSLRPDHISEIYNLEPIHQDPFDRALIAQATIEDLTLVTTDALISQYASERFRVLS